MGTLGKPAVCSQSERVWGFYCMSMPHRGYVNLPEKRLQRLARVHLNSIGGTNRLRSGIR